MADGYASQYLPAMSRLLGEVEQPTQTQGLMSPQFGGSPEQLMGILQHPDTQAVMQKLGIHFDPSTLRQSPFLPNSFMQGHPGLGHALTGAMANVAATPKADLVQGFGTGFTNAAQGMQGGPELLRQYQIRQMLSPMQAMGAMIPGQEFQRKQQLLQLLQKMEEDRQQGAQRHEQYVEQSPAGRLQNEILAPPGAPGYFTREPARPAQIQPPSGGMMGGGALGPMQPGPMQPAGPQFHPYDPNQILSQHPERLHPERQSIAQWRQAQIDAGMPEAQVDKMIADAQKARSQGHEAEAKGQEALAKVRGETPENYAKFSAQFNKEREEWQKRDQHIRELEASSGVSPEAAAQMRQANDDNFEQAKKTIDDARKAGAGVGASQPWQRPGPITPGAKSPQAQTGPGRGAQAGGAGSQKSEGTATAPVVPPPQAPRNPYLDQPQQ